MWEDWCSFCLKTYAGDDLRWSRHCSEPSVSRADGGFLDFGVRCWRGITSGVMGTKSAEYHWSKESKLWLNFYRRNIIIPHCYKSFSVNYLQIYSQQIYLLRVKFPIVKFQSLSYLRNSSAFELSWKFITALIRKRYWCSIYNKSIRLTISHHTFKTSFNIILSSVTWTLL